MSNTTTKEGNTRKTTYSERLAKEIAARKPVTGVAALLQKLNPFAFVTAHK